MTYNVFGGTLSLTQSINWAHFTVHRFISIYLCVFCVFVPYCIVAVLLSHSGLDLVGLKPNP